MSRTMLRSGILAVLLLAGFAGVGQTHSPVVRAVLLYSPTCSDCHQAMTDRYRRPGIAGAGVGDFPPPPPLSPGVGTS